MKKIIYLSIFTILLFTSCKKLNDFGDTNINPAATNSPIISALLTNVEAGLGGYTTSTRGGYYCQYFSETQYSDVSLYSRPNTIELWGTYSGELYDLENIIKLNSNQNMSAVAKIIKAYIFWTLTDRWGDIPYSEAFQGAKNRTPKFDTQEEIYKSLITLLKTAVTEFEQNLLISGDIIYNGDIAKWKKLANSLRLLMTLRLTKVYPNSTDFAAVEFKNALNDPGGVISENTDNFQIKYPGGSFKSPWFNLYDGRKDQGESKVMVDILANLGGGDLRQSVFGSSNIGVPYGLKRESADTWAQANPTWSRILSANNRTESSSVYIVTASQVSLARAEAADRGWTSEIASTLYNNGITLSYTQWDLAPPNQSYLTAVALQSPQGTNANFSKIALQQYISYYPDGLQGWSHYRRTGIPTLIPAIDAINDSKKIPRRYEYSSYEYNTNSVKLKEAIARIQGGDSQDSRIWWDK